MNKNNGGIGLTPLYREKYRPQFHLTPPEGPMSDPNGMVYFDGEYHQFYQFTGRWGHAVSRDLVHWEHLPLALDTDELGDIWSGSAVVDWQDSSGFFDGEPGLVAIFTHFKDGLQSQSIAYSADRGRSWTKYVGNPVIPNPGLKDFRDPKVLWHEETKRWIMAVSVDRRIYFYSSADLKSWLFESEFGEGMGSHAAVWECPDLFRLQVEDEEGAVKWVLHVSIGDNEVTDGSSAQYFVGEFDGHRFTVDEAERGQSQWTDYGQDYYAAVSYSDLPESQGRQVWLGWTSNWKYPFSSPTAPWKGGMSIPRSISLRRGHQGRLVLVQDPIEELKSLRLTPRTFEPIVLEDGVRKLDLDLPVSNSYEFSLEISWEEAASFGLRLCSSPRERQYTEIGCIPSESILYLDRTNSGFSGIADRSGGKANFAKRFEAHCNMEKRTLKMRGFVDQCLVEWFIEDGEHVFTSLIYPDPESTGVELFATGGKAVFSRLEIFPLQSIWNKD